MRSPRGASPGHALGMLPPTAHYEMLPPQRPAMLTPMLDLAAPVPVAHGSRAQEWVGTKASTRYRCFPGFGNMVSIKSDKKKKTKKTKPPKKALKIN